MIKTLLPASKLPRVGFFDCEHKGGGGFQTDNRDVAWELLANTIEDAKPATLIVTGPKGTTTYDFSFEKGKLVMTEESDEPE